MPVDDCDEAAMAGHPFEERLDVAAGVPVPRLAGALGGGTAPDDWGRGKGVGVAADSPQAARRARTPRTRTNPEGRAENKGEPEPPCHTGHAIHAREGPTEDTHLRRGQSNSPPYAPRGRQGFECGSHVIPPEDRAPTLRLVSGDTGL